MNAKKTFWVGAALVGALTIAINGCSNDDDKSSGGTTTTAEAGPSCTAGAKECVSTRLARVCPQDGSGWLSISCGVGELCGDGECKLDPNAACPAGAATCVNDTTALRCKADQKGYEQVTCPTGTNCVGAGQCAGACVVGSSICLDNGTVGTCNDGKTYTASSCTSTQACVRTALAPTPQAACKEAECHPTPGGCASVCGDPKNPATDAAKTVSTCTETANGWKWVATTCAGAATCNPVGHECQNATHGGVEAACAAQCRPGTSRCTTSAGVSGIQTCGTDGTWGAMAACTGTDVCGAAPNEPGKVRCADPICATANATGACVAGGSILLCDANGKLAAASTPCAGTCLSLTTNQAFPTPGRCVEECKAGDERCVTNGSTLYQTCDNGKWSTPSQCADADGGPGMCFSFVNASGRPARVCGAECSPGQTRCGTTDGAIGNDALQTCDASGHWAAPVECSVGLCQTSGNRASCVAECVPGTTVCTGSNRAVAGTPYTGRDGFGTCTTKGRLPTTGTTTCNAGLACRSVRGVAVAVAGDACLECIGPSVPGGNEDGFPDTRCSTHDGDAGGTASAQTCSASNVWVGGATADCSAAGKTCQAPSKGSVNKIDTCQARNGHYYSESYFASQRPFHGPTTCRCATKYCSDYGEATQCGNVADCCGTRCTRAQAGQVARCQ